MNKTLLSIAITTILSANNGVASAVTLNFTTNLEGDNTAFPSADPVNSAAFGTLNGVANPDFRMMNSGGASGGGEHSVSSGISWVFDDISNELIAVAGTEITPGAAVYSTHAGLASAAPDGDVGLFKNADFLGSELGFLAPTVGSAAGDAYGPGIITGDLDGDGFFNIFFPVLEWQWSGAVYTDGLHNGGNTFNCSSVSGIFHCQAETLIATEDGSIGFGGQYVQFDLTGTISSVPVPAAVWLFGSGLIGLVGFARRKSNS